MHFESKVQVRVPLCKFEFIPRKEFFKASFISQTYPTKLDVALICKQQISSFQISMDYFVSMKKVKALQLRR